jgi:hypothetical protein
MKIYKNLKFTTFRKMALLLSQDGRRVIFRNVVNFIFYIFIYFTFYNLYFIHNKDDGHIPRIKRFTMV